MSNHEQQCTIIIQKWYYVPSMKLLSNGHTSAIRRKTSIQLCKGFRPYIARDFDDVHFISGDSHNEKSAKAVAVIKRVDA